MSASKQNPIDATHSPPPPFLRNTAFGQEEELLGVLSTVYFAVLRQQASLRHHAAECQRLGVAMRAIRERAELLHTRRAAFRPEGKREREEDMEPDETLNYTTPRIAALQPDNNNNSTNTNMNAITTDNPSSTAEKMRNAFSRSRTDDKGIRTLRDSLLKLMKTQWCGNAVISTSETENRTSSSRHGAAVMEEEEEGAVPQVRFLALVSSDDEAALLFIPRDWWFVPYPPPPPSSPPTEVGSLDTTPLVVRLLRVALPSYLVVMSRDDVREYCEEQLMQCRKWREAEASTESSLIWIHGALTQVGATLFSLLNALLTAMNNVVEMYESMLAAIPKENASRRKKNNRSTTPLSRLVRGCEEEGEGSSDGALLWLCYWLRVLFQLLHQLEMEIDSFQHTVRATMTTMTTTTTTSSHSSALFFCSIGDIMGRACDAAGVAVSACCRDVEVLCSDARAARWVPCITTVLPAHAAVLHAERTHTLSSAAHTGTTLHQEEFIFRMPEACTLDAVMTTVEKISSFLYELNNNREKRPSL